jgi:hypothetical protein
MRKSYQLLFPTDLQEKHEKARMVRSLRHPTYNEKGYLVVLGL